MAELSTVTTSWLLEWLESHSVPGEEWTAGVCEPEDLSEDAGTIDWETFAALCDRLTEFSEDPPPSLPLLPPPAEIAREIAEELFLASATPARSRDLPAEILFLEEVPTIARELFPALEVRADVAADGEVVLFEFKLPDVTNECPAFFELIKGALEAAPLLVDQEAADVALEVRGHRARYAMRIPSRLSNVIPIAGRIEAELDEEFDVDFDRAMDSQSGCEREFDDDDGDDNDRRSDSFEADRDEAPQAFATRIPKSRKRGIVRKDVAKTPRALDSGFAVSLAALSDERAIGEHLFACLRDEFRSFAAQISIGPDAFTARTAGKRTRAKREERDLLRFEFGASDKPPSHCVQLAAAGKPLGRLDIWNSESLTDSELDRLDQIVPWYTLALRAAILERRASTKGSKPAKTLSTRARGEDPVDSKHGGSENDGAKTKRPNEDSADRRSAINLIESNERYQMLAENPFELIAEMDENATFLFANTTFESVLGYTPASLLGTAGSELIHEDDRQAVIENFSSTVARLGTSQISFRARHRNGEHRSFETILKAYRSALDKLVVILISRDISDRVESDRTLRQTEQKLLQSQKMEAIGRMAGGVAHDFNNLLTAITGYCDLLLDELGTQHPARADAEEILKASERAAGLTHQLLAFSRRQVLQPLVLDLNHLVADMDRMLRRLISEGIELVTVLGGGAWPVKADPNQLQQVILNLVVNSRDAMPAGGRITIETANVSVSEPFPTAFGAVPLGDYLTVCVDDTGDGMPPEMIEMIFEPFFTTKESGKGTGLGLSTVIGIVQQSGGHIDLQSTVGRGSCFTIYLPRAENVAMLPERESRSNQFRGKETVLLVEDSEPVRRLVLRCLKSRGYSVLEAGSGVEALRVCNRHQGTIDLLLTDVILPKMDGFEVAKRVVSMRPTIKILYMSGFTDDALIRHDVSAQDVALLEKPFSPSTLLRTVREYLDDGTQPVTPLRADPSDDSGL